MKNLYTIIVLAIIYFPQTTLAQNSIPISSGRATVWLEDSLKTWKLDTSTNAYDDLFLKYYYSYDANNNNTYTITEIYGSGVWTPTFQDSSYYNNQNIITSELNQAWSGTAWGNNGLYFYYYNSQNEQDSFLVEVWNAGAWGLSSSTSNTYNAGNQLISTLGWKYSPGWQYSTLDTFTYGTNNKLATDLKLNWTAGSWVNSNLNTYSYDVNNNNTGILFQNWSGTAWVDAYSKVNAFDANNNLSSVVTTNVSGGAIDDSIHYYYHEVTTGVTDITNSNFISVYPNPAGSSVNISFTNPSTTPLTVTLYDITGRMLLRQLVSSNPVRINTSNIAAGVYQVLVADDEGNRMVRQVVVR